MLSPGPPPALHRRAARLQPVRGHSEPPGPARPRLRGAPRPDRPPSGPSGRRSAGEGSEGRPRPGRGHAQAPRVTRGWRDARGGRAAGLRITAPPPTSEARSAQDSVAAAGHPLPLPGPRGQRQLVIVRAQRTRRHGGRPSPSAPPVEACPTRHTLRLRSPERGAEGQLPPRLGCWNPAPQDWSGTQARALPAPPPAVDGGIFGLAEVAPPGDTFGEYTVSPPSLGGPYLAPQHYRESSFRSRDVREAGVPTPPPPHHSPRATCAAAPPPAQLQLQHGHFLAADPPARSQLRAPDSGRPPGPAW
ncbi:proline-rich protein 2-like [Enhydra lutris kenyoni]|uniref:Proline-rich protein 2-like n=1 Tax=Enhydra lutris kenyoni TaxID=391180 RepID=A0A2Y9J4C5_ENHLU|nr:proline-rich protein 2-like [Enhydra lutris kenyoni]